MAVVRARLPMAGRGAGADRDAAQGRRDGPPRRPGYPGPHARGERPEAARGPAARRRRETCRGEGARAPYQGHRRRHGPADRRGEGPGPLPLHPSRPAAGGRRRGPGRLSPLHRPGRRLDGRGDRRRWLRLPEALSPGRRRGPDPRRGDDPAPARRLPRRGRRRRAGAARAGGRGPHLALSGRLRSGPVRVIRRDGRDGDDRTGRPMADPLGPEFSGISYVQVIHPDYQYYAEGGKIPTDDLRAGTAMLVLSKVALWKARCSMPTGTGRGRLHYHGLDIAARCPTTEGPLTSTATPSASIRARPGPMVGSGCRGWGLTGS